MSTGRRAKVGLILCTFALCGVAAISQRWREARRARAAPRELYEVVLAQMSAFRAADYPRAYRHVSNSLQGKLNVEAYADFARHDHPELRRAERIEFGPVLASGLRASVPTYFFFSNGEVIPCVYSLIRESDAWKVDAVRVHPRWPAQQPLRGTRL